MTVPQAKYVWFDGEFVPWEDARVHVLTHSLHYGLGVFEGTRAYEQEDGSTAVFRLDDHLQRLERSARILELDLPHGREELHRATVDLIAENELKSAYIRHIAFVGRGVMGLHPRDNPIHTAILAWSWGSYLGEDGIKHGIRCKISSYVRAHPNSSLSMAKCTANYVNSILAKREVTRHGYTEAILLDTEGYVAEGSGENIFAVRNGILKTPPLTAVLEGITRDTVIRFAKERGYEVREGRIARDELYIADEVFMTGTAAEITPVVEIDDRPIGNGKPGPVTGEIQQAYFSAVEGGQAARPEWLTTIPRKRAA